MSKSQSWALFCATKLDVRGTGLTYDEASSFLDRFNKGETEVIAELRERGATGAGNGKPKSSKADHKALYERAWAAADAAAEAITPTPMAVGEPVNMMASLMGGDDGGFRDDRPQYVVNSGVCGFAWVNIKPATSSFARWLKENTPARRDSYYGGISIRMPQGGQSYEIKVAAARAFAEVLREAGIKCYAYDRLD